LFFGLPCSITTQHDQTRAATFSPRNSVSEVGSVLQSFYLSASTSSLTRQTARQRNAELRGDGTCHDVAESR